MKQRFLLIFLLIISIKSFSQDSKLSVELNYPFPIGDNFLGKNYIGIIDAGVKYRFLNLDVIKVGASLNSGIYAISGSSVLSQTTDVYTFSFSPRVCAEFNIKSIPLLHPYLGIGYSIMHFRCYNTGINEGEFISGKTLTVINQHGINLNMGFTIDINSQLFAQLQYDFIRLKNKEDELNTNYNRNISLLKVGLGYRF